MKYKSISDFNVIDTCGNSKIPMVNLILYSEISKNIDISDKIIFLIAMKQVFVLTNFYALLTY